ncbi:MAG: cytidine deaminase [Blautia sp.]|nr:cytidine deaminase [Aeriscardovia sp.]MBQ1492417.1 cytidine deaminase [Blautia sp.]
MTDRELMELAFEAQKKAYAPYSHFEVGAALLTKGGKVYQGANIENAAFQAGNCAERTALYTAVNAGEREFSAIAIVGKKRDAAHFSFCSPCGVCRQALREFVNPKEFRVLLGSSLEDIHVYTLEEILPLSFGPQDLL